MRKFVEPIMGIPFNKVIFEGLKSLPYEAEYYTIEYLQGCWEQVEYNWNQRRLMFK